MNKLMVSLGDRSYPIYIVNDYSSIGKCLSACTPNGKIAVITDTNVNKYQAEALISALNASGDTCVKYVLEAGESFKTLDAVSGIYSFLASNRFDRNSTLIALGGGVVGDITGFAAATYLRGINFVQVPTTVLAQSDSSVGGKTGVDFEGHKNAVGAFYQPRFVYINVNSLRSLPEREIRSGLAEVIKHGIICDADFFSYISENMSKILDLDEEVLQYIMKLNCTIKARIVQEDEKESDLRAVLNLGHTIGHAVESASDFSLLHGECVSIGIVGAFVLANHFGLTGKTETLKALDILNKAGLPTSFKHLPIDKIYEHMLNDKKSKNNKLKFILPKAIGEVVQVALDDEALIKKVLGEISEG